MANKLLKFKGFADDGNEIIMITHSIIGCLPETTIQFTGLLDKSGVEIYADDILQDDQGRKFRIYQVRGGFVFKAQYWMENLSDLTETDNLILEALSDAQNASYISSRCEVVGNIHQNPKLL